MNNCIIDQCKNKYYANNYCRVHYNHNRLYGNPLVYKKGLSLEKRFWKNVDKKDDSQCWPWLAHTGHFGYGYMSFRKNGKWKSEGTHRISYRLHFGEIKDGLCVLHKCDNPICVNPKHLFSGTIKDNLADMRDKKRGKKGSDNTTGCIHKLSKYYAKGMCIICYMKSYFRNKKLFKEDK